MLLCIIMSASMTNLEIIAIQISWNTLRSWFDQILHSTVLPCELFPPVSIQIIVKMEITSAV